MLRTSCIYAYVFETPPPADAATMNMNKYSSIPHPFIIEPPLETDRLYEPDELIEFNLILVGRAVDYLPYFVYTFEEMGKTGIGRKRGKYRLLRVSSANAEPVYSAESRTIRPVSPQDCVIDSAGCTEGSDHEASMTLILSFITPARISYGRRLATKPDFHILVRALLRRIHLLHYFHVSRDDSGWDHKLLIAAALRVGTVRDNTRWWDWERYSTRQGERMKMGGLVGETTYEGNFTPFIPLLRAGEIFHLGKGTSFGLGKYTMRLENRYQPSSGIADKG